MPPEEAAEALEEIKTRLKTAESDIAELKTATALLEQGQENLEGVMEAGFDRVIKRVDKREAEEAKAREDRLKEVLARKDREAKMKTSVIVALLVLLGTVLTALVKFWPAVEQASK